MFRDGPLAKLWEGRAKYKKIMQGKLREKIHAQRVAQEKMFLHTEKNIPAREMLTKKIRAAQKFPLPPPITFLVVLPLV